MRPLFYCLAIIFVCLLSCKTKLNRYKNNQQHGKWVITAQQDSSIERYHKGIEVGVSTQYFKETLFRKERFKGKRSKICFYHPNGKISSWGWAQTDDESDKLHWYYTGKWRYYDINGKLTEIRFYEKGRVLREWFLESY